MARHVFTIGQQVQFQPGPYDNNVPRGAYTVTRLMPNDGTDREYRVRSTVDGHERVMRESQLRAGASVPPGW
ncbi:MAG TPA: hypothetical protein VE033_07375 [Acetobacteraceae bacterium]|jgi:hypothetical protein|nr:hypothetical protein [Acetobacteraceae bacterium]